MASVLEAVVGWGETVGGWVVANVRVWVYSWKDEWVHHDTCMCMDRMVDGQLDGWVDRWLDGWMNRQLDERMVVWMER